MTVSFFDLVSVIAINSGFSLVGLLMVLPSTAVLHVCPDPMHALFGKAVKQFVTAGERGMELW